jgi:mannose-1-phosphate guanylyltransferase
MLHSSRTVDLWAIVLAAGEGTRLAAVTQAVYGRPIPKQFAALGGQRTFLQRTMDRIAPIVPPERTVVVVAEHHADLAEEQLAHYPGVEIVRQPADRGTGVGLLLPLAHVLARDPEARVVVLPSDHHVQRGSPFIDAVKQAVSAAELSDLGVALVGAAAETAATDLGWIVPELASEGDGRAHGVARFVEKPGEATAAELLEVGALWNTLVIAAHGMSFWRLADMHVPAAVAAFDRYREGVGRPEARAWLDAAYAGLATVDLSRDILQQARGLRVVAMADAGWSDCGTPERLLQSMEVGRDRDSLRALLELGAAAVPAAPSS